MAKASRVNMDLLAEDRDAERFADAVLRRLDFGPIRPILNPTRDGKGSAKAWIDEEYARAAHDVVRSSKHLKARLLVITDADELSVAERIARLQRSVDPVRLAEVNRVTIHWIPKWHVETWLLALTGHPVDEESHLKSKCQAVNPDRRRAAQTFVDHVNDPSMDDKLLPSLKMAVVETRRLFEVVR